jgi:hypothetical protein
MTVKEKYYCWQTPKKTDYIKFTKASPNLVELNEWLCKRFGGASRGILNKRPIRGGSAPSTHTFGAALDWRYPSRAAAKIAMKFLIAFSEELGVQSIHDYVGACIWHAGRGWKKQEPDSEGMGKAWATWIHIEVTPSQWKDARPIPVKVGATNIP